MPTRRVAGNKQAAVLEGNLVAPTQRGGDEEAHAAVAVAVDADIAAAATKE
jgi:hypothetical protein